MKLNTKNLSEVSLGTPLLEESFVRLRLNSREVVPNSRNDGMILKLTWNITDPEVRGYADGKVYQNPNAQFTLWDNVSLLETDNYDPNRRLKEISIALFSDEDAPTDLELEHLIVGAEVGAKIRHQPEKDGYAARNTIGRYYHVDQLPENEFVSQPE